MAEALPSFESLVIADNAAAPAGATAIADPPVAIETPPAAIETPPVETLPVETPSAAETPPETPPSAPDGEETVTIQDYARQVLGPDAKAWIDKYGDDDAFLRGVAELQSKLGQRDEAGQTLAWLQQQGLTPQEFQAYQQWKVQQAQAPQQRVNGDGEWKDEWTTIGPDGKVMATASGQAALGDKLPIRYAQHQQELLGRLNNIERFVDERFQKLIPSLQEQVQQASAQQLAAHQQQLAEQSFVDANANLFFTGGKKDANGANWSPLAYRVGELVNQQLNPSLPHQERMQLALKIALGETQPKPGTKAPVKPTARAAAATPTVTSTPETRADEWEKKFPGNRNMQQYVAYVEKGEAPK